MSEKKMLANESVVLTDDERNAKRNKLELLFEEFLDTLGYDRSRDTNIKDTPRRMAKMYVDELLVGNFTEKPKITTFPNTKKYDDMVVVGPSKVKSLCSHHFVPFVGDVYVGYIPDKEVIGISKVSRIVKHYMRRPQLQEELTNQIAQELMDLMSPKGVIVAMKCQHHCMTIRGVEEPNSWMFTSAVHGAFAEFPATRKEFFDLVGLDV